MRFLGIDYGEKNVGLAVSDSNLIMAFPFTVIQNSVSLVDEIVKICKENEITNIVVGESRNFAQEENNVMKKIHIFVERLKEKTEIPVVLHPEFMTSIEAERLQGHNKMHDASAAALILKSYLETHA